MIARAAKIMGREVESVHLKLPSTPEDEEAKRRHAAQIDRANEKLQSDWDNYASRDAGIKISPALTKLVNDRRGIV